MRRVLEFVIDFCERNGHGPDYRTIGWEVDGLASSSVALAVKGLRERGDLIGGERPHTLQPAPHRRRDNHACPACGYVRVKDGVVV